MREFDLIRRLADRMRRMEGAQDLSPAVGVGDDAAVLDCVPGHQLVVTTDTLVSGVHFDAQAAPEDIGYKALAVSLSDLAAMGAGPAWHFLNLTLPDTQADWVERFATGMGTLAASTGSRLAGGDTTSGPLSITVTALGHVPRGQALLRSTARSGDVVVLSGEPGLAALALSRTAAKLPVPDAAMRRLLRPDPRLALGAALRGRATACIDVSDGVAADLGHILLGSGLAADLWLDRLPAGEAWLGLAEPERWNLQLGGGDDYELCFTVPEAAVNALGELAVAGSVALTVVGRVSEGSGLRCLRADGSRFVPERPGWEHFA